MTTRYVTDEALREAIGDAQIDPDSLGQVLEDATTIHGLVLEDSWLTDAALRSAAEKMGLDPDRTNAALAILESSGRLFSVELTEKQIPESPKEEEAAPGAEA